jgi:hypothetical protein
MYASGKSVDPEVWWEEIVIDGLTVQVDMRLQGDDHVGKVQILYCMTEYSTACVVIITKVHFSLELEVKEVRLCDFEGVVNIRPGRHLNWDDGVESWYCQLKDMPKVIVSIIGFIPNGCKGHTNLWFVARGSRG